MSDILSSLICERWGRTRDLIFRYVTATEIPKPTKSIRNARRIRLPKPFPKPAGASDGGHVLKLYSECEPKDEASPSAMTRPSVRTTSIA
jgi:hypothetical protein